LVREKSDREKETMGKKILITTGTSMHKREKAESTIRGYLRGKGIQDVEIITENVYTMDLTAIKPDLIVLIGPKNFKTDIPIVDGTAFITQIDSMVSDTCKKIEALL